MRPANPLIFLCLIAAPAIAQQINIPAKITDEAAWPRVMPRFAEAVIAFQQAEQRPELTTSLFKAQLVAGLYGDALARFTANAAKTPFQAAYRQAFHALISPLDNKTSALAVDHLGFDNLARANQALEQNLAELKGKTAASPAEDSANGRCLLQCDGP